VIVRGAVELTVEHAERIPDGTVLTPDGREA
jgi:hypothetical protein